MPGRAAFLLAFALQIPQPAGPSRPAPRLGPDPIVRFFVTAEPSAGASGFTVGLSRIVMIGAGGDRVVYRAKPPLSIDLGAFSGTGGPAYRFLCRRIVPNGVYDGIRVELDSHLTVRQPGGRALSAQFTKSQLGFKFLAIEFVAPRRFDSNRNLAIDFNLANWSIDGTAISVRTEMPTPIKHEVQVGVTAPQITDGALISQMPATFEGFVTGPIGRPPGPLSGMRQPGWILPVRFPPPRPGRGAVVRITGKYSVAADAFDASRVEFVNGKNMPEGAKPGAIQKVKDQYHLK